MSRAPNVRAIEFKPMTGRVVIVIQPHPDTTIYEIDIGQAEVLLTEFATAISKSWDLTIAAPVGPARAPPPPIEIRIPPV